MPSTPSTNLRPFFESVNYRKNWAKSQSTTSKVLRQVLGMNVKGPLFDTMIAHYLINPDMRHNMDSPLAETYLNSTVLNPLSDLIGKQREKPACPCAMCRLDKLTEYAVEDADITLTTQTPL